MNSGLTQTILFLFPFLFVQPRIFRTIFRSLVDKSSTRDCLIIVLAVVLHILALGLTPLRSQSIFEEIQMGMGAERLLTQGVIPLEYRWTTLWSALSIFVFGQSLNGLRGAFLFLGFLWIPLVYLACRLVCFTRLTSSITTFSVAVFPWFVISSFPADENESAMTPLIVAFVCIRIAQRFPEYYRTIAALLGICLGIIFYEFAGFKFMGIFLAIDFILHGILDQKLSRKEKLIFISVLILSCLAIILPYLSDILTKGTKSIFFDGPVRHASERSALFSYRFLEQLKTYSGSLLGYGYDPSNRLTPYQFTVTWIPVGILTFLGMFACLAGKFGRALFILSIGCLLAVLSVSANTNNVNLIRITPVLFGSHLLFGAGLELCTSALKKIISRVFVRIILITFGLLMCVIYLHRGYILSKDPVALKEYANSHYIAAASLAYYPISNDDVVVVSSARALDLSQNSIDAWIWRGRNISPKTDLSVEQILQVVPRSIVIMNDTTNLSDPNINPSISPVQLAKQLATRKSGKVHAIFNSAGVIVAYGVGGDCHMLRKHYISCEAIEL